MPRTRVIVSVRHPQSGDLLAAGAEVDLEDEVYLALRSQGAVEASEQEVKAHQSEAGRAGEYRARTGRGDVSGEAEVQVESETKPAAPKSKEK